MSNFTFHSSWWCYDQVLFFLFYFISSLSFLEVLYELLQVFHELSAVSLSVSKCPMFIDCFFDKFASIFPC